MKLFYFLPLGLGLASPVSELVKRAAPATQIYSLNSLNVQPNPSGAAFLTLDNGVGFYFQTDGNFVIYNGVPAGSSNALWSSQTSGHDCIENACDLIFQGDGNLVIYVKGNPKWSSNTAGKGNSLVFRDQKPLISIYDHGNNRIWGTAQPSPPPREPGEPGGGGAPGGPGLCCLGCAPCIFV